MRGGGNDGQGAENLHRSPAEVGQQLVPGDVWVDQKEAQHAERVQPDDRRRQPLDDEI